MNLGYTKIEWYITNLICTGRTKCVCQMDNKECHYMLTHSGFCIAIVATNDSLFNQEAHYEFYSFI